MLNNYKETLNSMNSWGSEKTPFVFLFDFELKKPLIFKLEDTLKNGIKFKVEDGLLNFQNFKSETKKTVLPELYLNPEYLPFSLFESSFNKVVQNLNYGNSFLTNLTAPTEVKPTWPLENIFYEARAKYKIWFENNFVSFSPETFVQINQKGVLSSFPMKGTIRANVPNAKEKLLNDPKELYEHTTIVDLIRNDVSKVCNKVWVSKFRYLDEIITQTGEKIYQLSSQINGQLETNWKEHIGDIFEQILPAGSISGAPKDKTLEIIKNAEMPLYQNQDRGYYTGVFGYFNGQALTSAVLIRFIEENNKKFYYKSGGGITTNSNAISEYEELKTKIYVPIF